MARYLVAVDLDIEISKEAFQIALRLASQGDLIYLVSVLDEVKNEEDGFEVADHRRLVEKTQKELECLGELCLSKNLRHSTLVISDVHPGKALCRIAKQNQVDCMIVGRRDLSALARMVTTSISKYCLENAECNVLVVKRPYHHISLPIGVHKEIAGLHDIPQISTEYVTPPPASAFRLPLVEVTQPPVQTSFTSPPETIIHTSPVVTEATEGYRQVHQARIEKDEELRKLHAEQYKLEKIKQFESLTKTVHTKQLEEEERARRLAEVKLDKLNVKKESELNRIKVDNLMEEERRYRIAKLKQEDDLEAAQRKLDSLKDLQLVKELEEEERRVRIIERKALLKLWEEERATESRADLDQVKELEEVARKEMIARMEEHRQMLLFTEKKDSIQNLLLTKTLEEQARAEKLLEIQEASDLVREESLLALERVKKLEEEERQRRMVKGIAEEHTDIKSIEKLEEEERLRRMNEVGIVETADDVEVEQQLRNQSRMLTEHLEEKERARRMKVETKNEEFVRLQSVVQEFRAAH